MSTALQTALNCLALGISVLPIKDDGTKGPALDEWKHLQRQRMTEVEARNAFRNGLGLAAIGGRVSGNLEIIDFDDAGHFNAWAELVEEHLGKAFFESLVIVRTPRPGFHVYTRCSAVSGNQKLAQKLIPDSANPGRMATKTLIETKGEGGYCLLPGCPPACHETGRIYELIQGDFRSIPELTSEQRETLMTCARSFNELVREEYKPREAKPRTVGDRLPGDDFNDHGPDFDELLKPHGYKFHSTRGECTLWTRPDKEHGISASTNYAGSNLFYAFSTNCYPFDHERGYSRFAVYAILNHNGDFSAAAKELARQGYGGRRAPTQRKELPAAGDVATEEEREREAIQQDGRTNAATGFVYPNHWRILDAATVRDWTCTPLRPIVQDLIAAGNFVLVAAQSQTGKTLLMLDVARRTVQREAKPLFGKLAVTPIDKAAYFVLEDPDRRIQSRLLDNAHEYDGQPALEPGRLTFIVAPGFALTDDAMYEWMRGLITQEKYDVAFLDTYQRATPGIASFDDEAQSVILHRLATLTRELGITLVVIDHVRKSDNHSRRSTLSIDDIKGTGGKAQNADCVILMERTPDRAQIKFQAFSKDFDRQIGFLIKVAPAGSTGPKFEYVADLEELGNASHQRSQKEMNDFLESLKPGEWVSVAEMAKTSGKDPKTIQRWMGTLAKNEKLDVTGSKKYRRYCRLIGQAENVQ